MINIMEQKLTKLINKYDIYKYVPNMYAESQAENILRDLFCNKYKNKKIAIWGGGWHTYHILKALDEYENIVAIIDRNPDAVQKFDYGIKVVSPKENISEMDIVVISSFFSRRDIQLDSMNMFSGVEIIDLYDYFDEAGLFYNAEYYKTAFVRYDDILIDRLKYNKKRNLQSLMRLIGDYVAIRDFKNAFFYIDCMDDDEPERKRYLEFKENTIALLEKCKEENARKRNVIINWVDALRYDEINNMPYLSSLMGNSVFFENAYTQVNYTSGTMKSILGGVDFIDDELYKTKIEKCLNDEMINQLKEANVDLMVVSGHWRTRIEKFSLGIVDLFIRIGRGRNIPCSLIQWWALAELYQSHNNMVVICHMIEETHPSYKSGEVDSMSNIGDIELFNMYKENYEHISKQIKMGQEYIDKQLQWYRLYYGQNDVTIYMSDHGQYRDEKPLCVRGLFHVMFMIVGYGRSYCEQRMFELKNMGKVLKNIINGEKIKGVFSNCVIAQTDDPYEPNFWERIRTSGMPDYILAYIQKRIIITPYDLYMRLKTGQEFYLRRDSDKNLIDDERYIERIEELKEKCGDNFIDVEKEPGYEHMIDFYSKGWKYE